ncbi:MAG TPA: hypothetical protein RMF84_00680 [Polyangiaceae bacterium LLY-WYZ-14_1]|nr:hypothetical protein [Polyangiaceae bacterium LLY-WYZ-14_1]
MPVRDAGGLGFSAARPGRPWRAGLAVLLVACGAFQPTSTAAAQWQGPRAPPRVIEVDGRRIQTEPREGRFRPRAAFAAEVTTAFGNLDGGTGVPPGRYVLVSPVYRGFYRLAERWAVSADWGFAADTEEGETTWGNPFFAGHFLTDLGDGTARIGFGVGLPTANGETSPEEVLSGLPVTARAGYEAYLFLPETLALLVPTRIETFTAVLFAAELTAGAIVPTGGEAGRSAAAFFQIVGELGAVVDDTDLGLRIGAAATAGADASLLTFLEPFFRLHLGVPYLQGRFTYGMDDPDQSVTEGRWGLSVGLGIELE